MWTSLLNRDHVDGVQVDAARYRLYEGANTVKSKAQQYSQEAKDYVKAKTDTSTAA